MNAPESGNVARGHGHETHEREIGELEHRRGRGKTREAAFARRGIAAGGAPEGLDVALQTDARQFLRIVRVAIGLGER